MPIISVIIPAYNVESTIAQTIDSVLKQTFNDFEVIVIDDGSTDRTVEIVRAINDPRISIFSYRNGGLPVARNRGIGRAKGEYLAFLDADDLWTVDKLAKQHAALVANPEAGVAYSQTCYIDRQGKFLYNCHPIAFAGNVLEQLLLTNFLSNGSNPLIRRRAIEAVGEFDPNLKSSEDWDYYLRLAAKYTFVVVPEYQILYRQGASNMSRNVETMKQTGYIVLNRAYQAAPTLASLRPQSFSIFHLYCAELHLRNSQFKPDSLPKVATDLWLAIRLYPRNLLKTDTQRILVKYLLKQMMPQNLPKILRFSKIKI